MSALYEQFFLFGDSITQDAYDQTRGFGFAAALQAAYIRRLDVVNRGLSGYNTRQALQILPSIIPSPEQVRIRFLVVFFGANDASLSDAPNKQHVPLEEYKSNIKSIVTHTQVVAHDPRIILIAPPPINEHMTWAKDQLVGYPSPARVAGATKAYADAVCEVGARLGVPVLNLWEKFMEKADFQLDAWKLGDPLPGSLSVPPNDALIELMHDGLHLSPAGYSILFQELMKVVGEQWPDQMPDKLPMVLPPWNNAEIWEKLFAGAQ